MHDIFYTGPKPNLFLHEQPANTLAEARLKSRTRFFWLINGNCDYAEFDFNWMPPKWEQHQTHRHRFYSTWSTPSPVDVDSYFAIFAPTNVLSDIDHWHDPKFLDVAPRRDHWCIPEEVDASIIDFSWRPPVSDCSPYIYHFSTEFQISVGLTYTVPGATEIKFAGDIPAKNKETAIVKAVDIFFVDMNNKSSNKRFSALQVRYPNIQRIRFMNSWVETIKRCVTRSSTTKFWVISSENVYDEFNFEWHAEPWQNFMLHIFGSQWQKWSDTFLINKHEFSRHSSWAVELEQFPNLHFVCDQKVYRPDDMYDIYYLNHSNPESESQLLQIQQRYPEIKVARYADNYLGTFKRIISTAESEYIWIINSICDYSKFDFTWQPEPWQATMLHVFPSNTQKYGDTFYVHVPSFKEQMEKISLLDWFESVNYCDDQSVPRHQTAPFETVVYHQDSVVDAIVAHDFTGPYTFFKSATVSDAIPSFTPSLWRKRDKVVHVFTRSGSIVAVPREAKEMIHTQVYDYPHITTHPESYVSDHPLDIVFISNGEPDAQRWYDHLQSCAPNRTIHWVKDVPGRAAAYKAAANVSTTPWFFAVFAKLEVDTEFDFDWQPDYLQEPKHYIFNAKNPVNDLEYGHMAILAYNKNLVLETEEYGLDFTLSKKHEVVDVLSATAHFNVNPIITWRTAFRECVKLKAATDRMSKDRLAVWTTVAHGENSEWCLRGANDAVEYYDNVNGDYAELMKSFEWEWLDEYFAKKYQL